MLIDHLGLFFFDNFWVMRLIGRLAFPLFAFFIAEGWRYTRSHKRYVLSLLICAIISQVPYAFLHRIYYFNVIFTFLLAILCIYLIENYKKHDILSTISLAIIGTLLVSLDVFGFFDYGFLGVLLVLVFYFFDRNKDSKGKLYFYLFSALILFSMAIKNFLLSGFEPSGLIQLFGLLSLGLIYFYNNQKGKHNLKWLFYIFYPLHLMVIWIVTLII